MICSAAGPDPEDLYDCKLKNGHTLTEVMRVMSRQVRDAQEQHLKDIRYSLEIVRQWKKSLADIQKDLEPAIQQQEKRGKS